MRIFDKFAQLILRSRFWAIAIAILLVFLPVLRWAGWAVLGLVTLRKGAVEGGFVLLGVGLSIVGMAQAVTKWASEQEAMQADVLTDMIFLGLVGVLLTGVLVWVLAIVLRQFASWSKVLQAGLWIGVGMIILIHAIHPDITAWWLPIIKENITRMFKSFPPEMKFTQEMIEPFSSRIAQIMTGVQVVMALLVGLFSLLIARWWQALLYNPGGLRPELLNIRFGLPEIGLLCGVAFLGLTDISTTGKAIAIDSVPVIGMLFLLAGMSLVHSLLALTKKPWVGMVVFYVLLIVLFRYMIFLLVSLALLDSWLNLRNRLMRV